MSGKISHRDAINFNNYTNIFESKNKYLWHIIMPYILKLIKWEGTNEWKNWPYISKQITQKTNITLNNFNDRLCEGQ